jgi:hypothetical protein
MLARGGHSPMPFDDAVILILNMAMGSCLIAAAFWFGRK